MAVPATTAPQANPTTATDSCLPTLLSGAGLELTSQQVAHLVQYRDLLHLRNGTTNLTAIRDLPGIERRLILESVRLVEPIRSLPRVIATGHVRLLDLGTGGGIPGIVLAIACPELRVTLVDATARKIGFLDDAIRVMGLEHVSAHHGRAEEIGHDSRWRDQFDVVTARAVASLATLFELGLPLIRTGGHLVLPKGIALDDELQLAERAAGILGATVVSSDRLPDSGSGVETRLVIVRKVTTTPIAYPRRPGLPARAPLGVVPTGTRRKSRGDVT